MPNVLLLGAQFTASWPCWPHVLCCGLGLCQEPAGGLDSPTNPLTRGAKRCSTPLYSLPSAHCLTCLTTVFFISHGPSHPAGPCTGTLSPPGTCCGVRRAPTERAGRCPRATANGASCRGDADQQHCHCPQQPEPDRGPAQVRMALGRRAAPGRRRPPYGWLGGSSRDAGYGLACPAPNSFWQQQQQQQPTPPSVGTTSAQAARTAPPANTRRARRLNRSRPPVCLPRRKLELQAQAAAALEADNSWWRDVPGSPQNVLTARTPAAMKRLITQAPSTQLVVVDYLKPSCAGCRRLFPKLLKIAAANPDVLFLKVRCRCCC